MIYSMTFSLYNILNYNNLKEKVQHVKIIIKIKQNNKFTLKIYQILPKWHENNFELKSISQIIVFLILLIVSLCVI